jgi:hypothetical protein
MWIWKGTVMMRKMKWGKMRRRNRRCMRTRRRMRIRMRILAKNLRRLARERW